MHGNSADRRALEREALRNVINQWNANRLDLFELSEPNEVSFLKCRSSQCLTLSSKQVCFTCILQHRSDHETLSA